MIIAFVTRISTFVSKPPYRSSLNMQVEPLLEVRRNLTQLRFGFVLSGWWTDGFHMVSNG